MSASVISLALGLAQSVGLVDKVGEWFGGGKSTEVANAVVDVAREVTGTFDGKAAHDQILQDPEKLLAFEEKLHERMEALEQLAFEDRKDARKMQKYALQQDDLFSKRFVYYLAAFWSLFAATYISAITFIEVPAGSVRFADGIFTFLLGTIVATVVQYFFGSSMGSARKTEQMQLAGSGGGSPGVGGLANGISQMARAMKQRGHAMPRMLTQLFLVALLLLLASPLILWATSGLARYFLGL